MNGMTPVAKYDNGTEGTRYAWLLAGQTGPPFVESGAFCRRTVRGGSEDDRIAAYTTSVSCGCILADTDAPCAFCITGNEIGYLGQLSARHIALQNVFMALDDVKANNGRYLREFALMGQGEPGFAYMTARDAILGTDCIMNAVAIPVYRHIFATAGVPSAIRMLGRDMAAGVYGDDMSHVLLHLSVHTVTQRDTLMPINRRYPLSDVLDAANEYSSLTGQKSVVAFMLFKDATLKQAGRITTATVDEVNSLCRLLHPDKQRVVFFDFNPDDRIGVNVELSPSDVAPLEEVLDAAGIEHKTFIAFGRRDNLACGLLGGCATINQEYIAVSQKLLNRSLALLDAHMSH